MTEWVRHNMKLNNIHSIKDTYHTLRLVLGDQLNHQHSWWQETNDNILYVMMEVRQETDYVKHHIQKVIGFFLAMRAFSEEKQANGHHFLYLNIDDTNNKQDFSANLNVLMERFNIQHFEYQLPDEYRLDEQVRSFSEGLSISHKGYDTEHFLTKRDTVSELFKNKKTYLMETFYRKMRKQYDILMEVDGKTPLTGKWNYDAANRKKLPKKIDLPPAKHFLRDVSEVEKTIRAAGIATIGNVQAERFNWAITRAESLELLEHFIKIRLLHFGTYQDAMTERNYLLFHSKLSFAMNVKLLSPLEVVTACVSYWEKHQDTVSIAQLEGFVRQIIGWREYMRGIYWAKMPKYSTMNYFNHEAALPDFFWTGKTKMKCLSHSIGQSLDYAYAHHIQRLMVTGSFSLLLGVHPDEIDKWYLGIYMDAIEWVEITNTRGMSQFADGGIVGTKPYVGSANYINKMGDYCSNCSYDRKKRHGKDACPFNSLYWDFYDRHREKLGKNHRIGMTYRILDKMDSEELVKTLEQADFYKKNVNLL